MAQMPSSDLTATTSQEISFEPEQLTIKLQKITARTLPLPPLPSKHPSQKRVKAPSRRELPPSAEIKRFEGENTTEEAEELVEDCYNHRDGIVLFATVGEIDGQIWARDFDLTKKALKAGVKARDERGVINTV